MDGWMTESMNMVLKCGLSFLGEEYRLRMSRLVVLTAVTMKNTVFRNMILCSLVELHQRFSKTSAYFYHTAWFHVPEDSILLRLRIFESRLLRKMSRTKAEEVTEHRKLLNQLPHNLSSSLNIIRVIHLWSAERMRQNESWEKHEVRLQC
jgi:hypothetical protein